MKFSIFKPAACLLAASLFIGCTTPNVAPENIKPSVKPTPVKTPAPTPEPIPEISPDLITAISLFQKSAKGGVNPVVPESLEYIEINGKRIEANDVELATKVGEVFKDKISFDGTGKYNFDLGLLTELKDVIKFKLKDLKEPATIPIFQPDDKKGYSVKAEGGVLDVRAVITSDGNGNIMSVSGGFDINNDGKLDTTEYGFTLDLVNKKFIYFTPTGQRQEYDINVATSQQGNATPTAVETKDIKIEMERIQEEAVNVSSINSYVGNWKDITLGGLGIIVTISKESDNKFVAAAKVLSLGYNFEGTGTVENAAGEIKNIDFTGSSHGKTAKFRVVAAGPNKLNVFLLETDAPGLDLFTDSGITMSRKLN